MASSPRRESALGLGPVLIVDDDDDIRAGVSKLLARSGLDVVQAAGGSEAIQLARATRPSLVLLDVRLGDMTGYEVCRALRDEFGESLPIMFTSGSRTESIDLTAGFLLGADDYIVKPFDPDELVARIRRLRARAAGLAATRTAPPETLTARELEVLGLLAQGLRPAEIADTLVLSPKTVSTHLQRILGKLGAHSQAQAVSIAYQAGLVRDQRQGR